LASNLVEHSVLQKAKKEEEAKQALERKKKKAKRKAFKIILKVIFHAIVSIFNFILSILLMFLPVTLICVGGFLLIFALGDISEGVQNNIQAILEKFGISQNNELQVGTVNVGELGQGDLAQQPIDVTVCDGCNCEKIDYKVNENNNTWAVTHRLNKGEGSGTESFKNVDWMYDGWTIHDSETYWDVDYSKFSKREPDDYDRQYLFKWHVNDFSNNKCLITTESSNMYKDKFPEELDEDSRNGSFVNVKNPVKGDNGKYIHQQWLDVGAARVLSYDSRILSAFAPMVTAGEAGLKNLIKARQIFHKGNVWNGESNADSGVNRFFNGGLHLWQEDVQPGTYIDVVFEENDTGTQFVVPFIYGDAKNVHWFNSMGQRGDERYGQLHGAITQMSSNGTYETEIKMLKATFKVITYTQEGYDDLILKGAYQGLGTLNEIDASRNSTTKVRNNILQENYILDCIVNRDRVKKYLFLGKDLNDNDCFLALQDWEEYTTTTTGTFFGDNDTVSYRSFSPLETIGWQSLKLNKGVQDGNFWRNKIITQGWTLENADSTPDNSPCNVSLIGMRVYTDKKYRVKGYNTFDQITQFTEISKNMDTITEIPVGQKVIEFCGPECKCTICTKVAR